VNLHAALTERMMAGGGDREAAIAGLLADEEV
jgi:type IV secretory pathway TrbD component